MRRAAYCWIFLLGGLLIAGSAMAATRAYFTSQESVEKELVRLIDASHSSIDMALFRFASQPLAQAINRARGRKVKIRLVLDGHKEADEGLNNLKAAFVAGEVRRLDGKPGGRQGIMHHKFVLFDNARLVTGSFNWTRSAEHVNYENAIYIDDAQPVAQYRHEFQKLWERAEEVAPGQFQGGSGSSNARGHTKSTSISRKIKKALNVIMGKRPAHTKRK